MKVRDFANKIRHANLPYSVGIRRGPKMLEHIADINNLEKSSRYLDKTVDSICVYEVLIIISIE
nr:MAG TPA_asm: hypothetical protein [Caudoviricetes sp.]